MKDSPKDLIFLNTPNSLKATNYSSNTQSLVSTLKNILKYRDTEYKYKISSCVFNCFS